jgi:16S rRNA (guanine966-N2)-methyltransferase
VDIEEAGIFQKKTAPPSVNKGRGRREKMRKRKKKCLSLFEVSVPSPPLLIRSGCVSLPPMRITGGHARGIPLRLPSRGEIRPATDYLREAVFSSLGAFVPGARVLDLFAGTGAYGLEALSRGATSGCFVEKNPASLDAIRVNTAAVAKALQAAGADPSEGAGAGTCEILQADALRWSPAAGVSYDLIFCDPPWALWEREAVGLGARIAAWAAPGPDSRIILEAPGGWEPAIPTGWVLHRHLAKGKTQPSAFILKPLAQAAPPAAL